MFDPSLGSSLPVGFHFSVMITVRGIPFPDIHFQEVSGLNVDITTTELKEGGENRFKHQLPEIPKYNNLILKRGLITGSALFKWCQKAITTFDFDPAFIIISLLNSQHLPLVTWNVIDAFPVRWQTSNFNAETNDLAIETIEMAYKYYNVYRM